MFKRFNIRQKILAIVLMPILMVAVVALLAVVELNRVTQEMKAVLHDQGLVSTEFILNADRDMYQSLNNLQELVANANGSKEKKDTLVAAYRENSQQVKDRIASAVTALASARSKWNAFVGPVNGLTVFENFTRMQDLFKTWDAAVETLIRENRVQDIYQGTFLKDFDEARAYINEITDTMQAALDVEMDAEMANVRNTALTFGAASGVGVILVLVLTLLVTGAIVQSIRKAVRLIGELSKGHLSERVTVQPSERDEIAIMTRDMNSFADHLQDNVVGVMQHIANGDLTDVVSAINDQDEIAPALSRTLSSLKTLVDDARMLTDAAARGALDVRSDALNLKGAYAEIVQGVNATLDGVIRPINEARAVLGRMAVNDLGTTMSDSYKGMLAELSRDINQVRENLLDIQDAMIRSSHGDIGRLEEFERLDRRSPNDKLTPSLLAVCRSIRDITTEADRLTGAALQGQLSVRADLSRFEGGYRTIVDGFNKTIDALVRPIQDASAMIQELAGGNLTVRMEGRYEGDHAVMKNALNGAFDAFNHLLGDIRRSSEEVATGSQQLSNSSQSLAQGATEQASSIEEISASIEELAAQTRQNAGNAGVASELSAQARNSAIQGNQRMRTMLDSMNAINESSNNISKIIKVIDDIAFQTNILALNAAVEAARAGQHGRGFAVVAEEVRNLAARSAEAAKETTLMIENSIKRVNDGSAIANGTAQALEEIVEKVDKTTTLVLKISDASNEQASGIVQINEALNQVSRVIQMNSSASEQSASASEQLTGQADMLREMVVRFRLRA